MNKVRRRRAFMRAAEDFIISCPHCGGVVSIPRDGVRCGVFRHGVSIKDGTQVPPHAPKAECDRLAEEGLIYGCGKPFCFDGAAVAICGYV